MASWVALIDHAEEDVTIKGRTSRYSGCAHSEATCAAGACASGLRQIAATATPAGERIAGARRQLTIPPRSTCCFAVSRLRRPCAARIALRNVRHLQVMRRVLAGASPGRRPGVGSHAHGWVEFDAFDMADWAPQGYRHLGSRGRAGAWPSGPRLSVFAALFFRRSCAISVEPYRG